MVQSGAVVDARGSSVRRVGEAATPGRMSERLWGLAWSPWTHRGVRADLGTFEDAQPFIVEHYPTIFATEPNRFMEEKMTAAKLRYFSECDVHIFRDEESEKIAAIGIGHPTDWATYYIRTFALLPEYRERGVVQAYAENAAAQLRPIGVDRMEFETSPGNVPMNRMFLSLGCAVTGSHNTERWGMLLRYTLHLNPEAQSVFKRQFITVPAIGPKRSESSEK